MKFHLRKNWNHLSKQFLHFFSTIVAYLNVKKFKNKTNIFNMECVVIILDQFITLELFRDLRDL